MANKFFGFVISCLLGLSITAFVSGDSFNLSQYHRMPTLTEYDDYDQCLEDVPTGQVATYCIVRLVLKPDNDSKLWHEIEEFSNDQRHYNHRHLQHGVCVRECLNTVNLLSNASRKALRVEKFAIDYPYIYDVSVFKDTETNRERYAELLDICLNSRLNETFQLKAYTEIEVCDRSDESIEIDWLDMLFLFVCLMLIVLVILSSWYDMSINKKRDSTHYQLPLDTKRKMLYASFSILRNWYKLTARSQNQLIKELRFLQAIRFLTMHLVIMGHAALLFAVIPKQNTAKMEMTYHNIGTMILTGGVQITQTFFFISGLLLTIHVMSYADTSNSGKLGFPFLMKIVLYRYIRLTPAYAFVILLHATWLSKLLDGPLWKLGSEIERTFCRRNWWTNLLYINNYVNANQPCVQHGWYLGCDYQLFIVGSLLLILINRFRRFLVPIVVVTAIGSYVLPALFIYYQKLEAVFVITLESQRFTMLFDDLYLKSYIPLHVNTGNFLAGIVTGLIYIHLQKKAIDPVLKKWFCIIWYLVFPMAIVSFLLNYIFYVYDFEKPSLWMAVYFPVMKHSWGIFCGIFFIGITHGIQPVLKRIFDFRIFEPLGRMTYSAYLAHVFVMRLIVLSIRSPIHFSVLGMTTIHFAAVAFSYLMAILLCLTLEAPVASLQKQFLNSVRATQNE
ncbi:nose resistant to fluoxetine protein 6-like [Malaya genurostris]|uniref:nose resistant to fluoxetine protein 6-like n=1 Tax=Malaya genurostris TaxID=325434 RepID=UPI0026F3E3C4|nr:nose resistant to fluoxetine protein 6-like [Malaya genurostris]